MVSGRICDSADICNISGGILSSCKRWTSAVGVGGGSLGAKWVVAFSEVIV